MKKGVIVRYLCTNPSCAFSEKILEDKQALNGSSSTMSFKSLSSCPKCKSGIEMINFVSGSVEITEDEISQKEE